jgi:hypothetical protein
MAINSLDPAANDSVHNKLDEVIDRLRNLERRLSTATAQVCGIEPQDAETAPAREDHIQDKLKDAARYLSGLEHELLRLENAVGSSAPRKAASSGSNTQIYRG